MDRKLWNKLKPTQRLSILYINDMAYYPYHNARCSWGKLTEYMQDLLGKIELSDTPGKFKELMTKTCYKHGRRCEYIGKECPICEGDKMIVRITK